MATTGLSPTARAAIALLLFSSWLTLLFSGFALRGAVHLLLAAALLLFPWRALPGPSASAAGEPAPAEPVSPADRA